MYNKFIGGHFIDVSKMFENFENNFGGKRAGMHVKIQNIPKPLMDIINEGVSEKISPICSNIHIDFNDYDKAFKLWKKANEKNCATCGKNTSGSEFECSRYGCRHNSKKEVKLSERTKKIIETIEKEAAEISSKTDRNYRKDTCETITNAFGNNAYSKISEDVFTCNVAGYDPKDISIISEDADEQNDKPSIKIYQNVQSDSVLLFHILIGREYDVHQTKIEYNFGLFTFKLVKNERKKKTKLHSKMNF